ncbi:Hypothetical protein R9X50_00464000 [Acrodontium crateriforme]|uniref:Distal membrane-arm assembly complex protein 1-like domain-containing protein n=1 Tax=Acrodontium crateriforme TaxID=150365 RepID=A0AAQ3MBB9_9PEZI|nr:Hypothetical protein R9X50_00464000 [Acrodontium crateriforme]
MSKQPTLQSLDQPANLKTILAEQREFEDCTPCKLMGSAAFTGLGVYTYASGMSQLRQREREIAKSGSRFGLGARRMGIFGLSGSLVALGAYRLLN